MIKRWHNTLLLFHFLLLALHAVWTEKRVHVEWHASGKTIAISFLNHLFPEEQEAWLKAKRKKKG